MKITALKQQVKNADRVSIYIDGKYSVSLTISQLMEEKLKVGCELSEQELLVLKKKSSDGKLRVKAMNWVFLRPRSRKEVADYLKRSSYSAKSGSEKTTVSVDTATAMIDDFVARGWVSDDTFAQWWVERSSRKTKSISFLTSELMSKGIDRETIKSVLVDKEDSGALVELVARLSRKSKYQDKQKLTRYLVGKGFRYSSVIDALAEGIADSGD